MPLPVALRCSLVPFIHFRCNVTIKGSRMMDVISAEHCLFYKEQCPRCNLWFIGYKGYIVFFHIVNST